MLFRPLRMAKAHNGNATQLYIVLSLQFIIKRGTNYLHRWFESMHSEHEPFCKRC